MKSHTLRCAFQSVSIALLKSLNRQRGHYRRAWSCVRYSLKDFEKYDVAMMRKPMAKERNDDADGEETAEEAPRAMANGVRTCVAAVMNDMTLPRISEGTEVWTVEMS